MQATSVETSTVFITSSSNRFRVWYNNQVATIDGKVIQQGYWETDIFTPASGWMYFGHAKSLIQAMTNVAITL